jgi:predicted nucleic acid-binding protein
MLAVVCDSSPLVYLSKLGQFGLLRHIYEAVLVPPAVWQEVAVGGEGLLESWNLKAAVSEGWIQVTAPKHLDPLTGSFPKSMGRGEMEAIALARERRAVLVTDDAWGRATGNSLGLEVTGTIGVLIRGKKHGQIASVRPLIEQLRSETNFRISNEVYLEALVLAGESRKSDSADAQM